MFLLTQLTESHVVALLFLLAMVLLAFGAAPEEFEWHGCRRFCLGCCRSWGEREELGLIRCGWKAMVP